MAVIPAITGFSTLIYPHIKTAWGGGAPMPIILYTAKDARVLPNGQLEARLLDESESGFYLG